MSTRKPIKIEDAEDFASTLAENLTVTVVDSGIGPYEFWGAKGNDIQLGLEVNECYISAEFGPDEEFVPVRGSADVSVGGCDEEHSGRCRQSCREFSGTVVFVLDSISRTKDGGYIVGYDVKLD